MRVSPEWIIAVVAWLAVCALALWRGGRTERVGATLLAAGAILSIAAQAWTGSMIAGVYWPIALIDLGLLLAFVALAWRSERVWPAWAAGFQLVLVLSHLAALGDLRIGLRGYIVALNLASYAVLACLAAGTLQAWRMRLAADR